jgi:alkanesulfonate monooxygenase SsuD/methylene tetrahydromethanopterin reductase-like flavin-dependent oxidoreductase (luciferase family)
MWGAGKATYQGKVHSVSGAVSYPRPVGKIPIIVGGRGSRTVRLAGAYADGLNVVGSARVRETLELLRTSAAEVGRDPDAVELSILDTPLLGADRNQVAMMVEANRGRLAANVFAARHHAGTLCDHIERLRGLGASGVRTVFVSPVGLSSADGVSLWKAVIEALN